MSATTNYLFHLTKFPRYCYWPVRSQSSQLVSITPGDVPNDSLDIALHR